MNPANKKTDQSLSDFQIGIGVATYAILDMEHLISHNRTDLMDTIISLQDCNGGVIPVAEVHKILTKIHDILDYAISRLIWNTAHILAFLLNSASWQHHEVWSSQYPFIYNFKDSIPPPEACVHVHINWTLVKALDHSSLGLFQSSCSVRGGGTRHRLVSDLMCSNGLCQSLLGALWQRSLTQTLEKRVI